MTNRLHPMMVHVAESNAIEGVYDTEEVDRSLVAWDYLAKQPWMSMDVVLAAHFMILYRLWPQEAGRLRTHNVTVGGRYCPNHQDVFRLMQEWLNCIKFPGLEDPKKLHIDFEHIHPFADGNGRTGRMLMWWHQVKIGAEPLLIRKKDVEEY